VSEPPFTTPSGLAQEGTGGPPCIWLGFWQLRPCGLTIVGQPPCVCAFARGIEATIVVVASSVITTKDTAAKPATVEFFENFITTDRYGPSIKKCGDNYSPKCPQAWSSTPVTVCHSAQWR